MGYKLNICLIPPNAYGKNMRAAMGPSQWRSLSKFVREPGVCAGCGRSFPPAQLEAHEVWKFKKHSLRLRRLVPLCKDCHRTAHAGRAEACGHLPDAAAHYARVRKTSKRRFYAEYEAAKKRRNALSLAGPFKLKTSPEEAWKVARKDRASLEKKVAKKDKKE